MVLGLAWLGESLQLKLKYPLQQGANNPILRKKSEPIQKITPQVKEFLQDLKKLMYIYDWVWLAAPQIGKNLRAVAITVWQKRWSEMVQVDDKILVNPQIIQKSDEMNVDVEGCLSLPWVEGEVKRHNWVKVRYLDENWLPHEEVFEDFTARIVQHEIDHLDWILFIDKLES